MEAASPKQYVCSGALHICRQGQQQDTVRGCQGLQPAVCPATCHKQKHGAAEPLVISSTPGNAEGMTAHVPIRDLEGRLWYDVGQGGHHEPFCVRKCGSWPHLHSIIDAHACSDRTSWRVDEELDLLQPPAPCCKRCSTSGGALLSILERSWVRCSSSTSAC